MIRGGIDEIVSAANTPIKLLRRETSHTGLLTGEMEAKAGIYTLRDLFIERK